MNHAKLAIKRCNSFSEIVQFDVILTYSKESSLILLSPKKDFPDFIHKKSSFAFDDPFSHKVIICSVRKGLRKIILKFPFYENTTISFSNELLIFGASVSIKFAR
jgi:hypothetical protein